MELLVYTIFDGRDEIKWEDKEPFARCSQLQNEWPLKTMGGGVRRQ